MVQILLLSLARYVILYNLISLRLCFLICGMRIQIVIEKLDKTRYNVHNIPDMVLGSC